MPYNIGYCCINLTLQKREPKITTSRGMIKRTFHERGELYARTLASQNVEDLVKLIQWNVQNHVKVFRIGGGMFPWHHLWEIPVWDKQSEQNQHIHSVLKLAGDLARQHNIRVSTHPDHFIKLASLKPAVVEQSIHDLEIDSHLFDLMGYSPSYHTPINIHIGQGGNKNDVAKRFITTFHRLSPNLQKRLVIENDDKMNAWSVKELYEYIHSETGIPITFDYFHHQFHPDGLTIEEAFELAYMTWPDGIVPLFHYSESKNLNESVNGNPRAHSDFVYTRIDDYGYLVDIDLEAKAKELALQTYRSLHGETN